jgi:hypothetical protein
MLAYIRRLGFPEAVLPALLIASYLKFFADAFNNHTKIINSTTTLRFPDILRSAVAMATSYTKLKYFCALDSLI